MSGLGEGMEGRIANLQFLSRCPVFSGVHSEGVRNRIARAMEKHPLKGGATAFCSGEPGILLLASGKITLTCGGHLIESVSVGGFWGEELVVSTAPVLCEAHAEGDCEYSFVSGAILADILVVQWRLLETFERRMKIFQAGFSFDWLEFFSVGVQEMDEQHKRIFAMVDRLSGLTEKDGQHCRPKQGEGRALRFRPIPLQERRGADGSALLPLAGCAEAGACRHARPTRDIPRGGRKAREAARRKRR
jgi:hypothetical protein